MFTIKGVIGYFLMAFGVGSAFFLFGTGFKWDERIWYIPIPTYQIYICLFLLFLLGAVIILFDTPIGRAVVSHRWQKPQPKPAEPWRQWTSWHRR